jgi:hypothetical protein
VSCATTNAGLTSTTAPALLVARSRALVRPVSTGTSQDTAPLARRLLSPGLRGPESHGKRQFRWCVAEPFPVGVRSAKSGAWTSKRPRMRRGDRISNSVNRERRTPTTSRSSATVRGRSSFDTIRLSDGPGGAASLMRSLTCRGPDGAIAQPPSRGWLVLASPRRGRDRPLAATRLDVRRGPAHACSMGPGRGRPSGVLECHRMVGRHRGRARRAALWLRPGRTSATATTSQAAPLKTTGGDGQGVPQLVQLSSERPDEARRRECSLRRRRGVELAGRFMSGPALRFDARARLGTARRAGALDRQW